MIIIHFLIDNYVFIVKVLKQLIIKEGGQNIIDEYERKGMLSNKIRRQLVNIIVNIMINRHGTSVHRTVKIDYAQSIVNIFPNLKNPYTNLGYVRNKIKQK